MNYNKKIILPFKGWVLENFPFIEADFDAITNYQLICKVIEYLNKVIANENQQNEAIEDLYNKLIELRNYVDTRMPEEIDNKLDEMVEDGTLQALLLNYTQVNKVYDTYTEMISDYSTFVEGMKLKTLGYYDINDDGGGEYIVTSDENTDAYQVEIGTLYLELIDKADLNVEQFGAYGDGTHDDTTAIQNALNFCFTKGKNLNFRKKYLVTSSLLSDNTRVCLLIQETNRLHMLYGTSLQINFLGEASLITREEQEATLLRIDAGNIKFNNLRLDGVLNYTTLIELSRGNKLDTNDVSFASHNVFNNLRLLNANIGINIEGGCYYNVFNGATYRTINKGLIIGFTYAERQGLIAEDACNRNTFLNMKFGGIYQNGIKLEYGDTNKFVNINFEGVANPIYIDDPYNHKTDFPIEPLHISNDNMFVNITMEATSGKQIYNNAQGTKFINCSSRFIRADWIIKPQTYIGGVDSFYSSEKFGNFYKIIGDDASNPYENAPYYTTILTDSGLVSKSIVDFAFVNDEFTAYNRQSFNFVLKEDSNVDQTVGIEYSANKFVKSIGGIVHLSTKFKFKAITGATSIKLYFDKEWINNATGLYANTIGANRIPVILSIGGTEKIGVAILAYDNINKSHIIIKALDGTPFVDSADTNIVYLNLSMFRDNNYNLL